MLWYTWVFLVIALLAALLGFGGWNRKNLFYYFLGALPD
jgi:uncharacterized membrane protein YtjA (UPF0391 family)